MGQPESEKEEKGGWQKEEEDSGDEA